MNKILLILAVAYSLYIGSNIIVFYVCQKAKTTPSSLTVRSNKNEQKVQYIRKQFNILLKSRKLSNKEIKMIKNELMRNVRYERKQYSNDAHFIYSQLIHANIPSSCINKLYKYLKNKEDLLNDKDIEINSNNPNNDSIQFTWERYTKGNNSNLNFPKHKAIKEVK